MLLRSDSLQRRVLSEFPGAGGALFAGAAVARKECSGRSAASGSPPRSGCTERSAASTEVRGRENIPTGGFIVASKHQSAWETLRLIELFPRPSFILEAAASVDTALRRYMWKAHMIPVDRGKGSAAIEGMMVHARRAIAEGRQIIIFPEGTRRPPACAARLPSRRDAALPRPRRAVPAGGAELGSVLATPLFRASTRHDLRRLPLADPAGPPPTISPDASGGDRRCYRGLIAEALARQPGSNLPSAVSDRRFSRKRRSVRAAHIARLHCSVRQGRACQNRRLYDPLQRFAPRAPMEVLPVLAKALPTLGGRRCRSASLDFGIYFRGKAACVP